MLTLSNGVRVILKPTDFKNNEILFSSFSSGGTSLYSDADYQNAATASSLIQSFGVGNYGVTDLSKHLCDKQLNVQPYIGERIQGLNGSTTPKDMEDAFQLMFAYLTEPRSDETQFNSVIKRTKASLVNSGNDSQYCF